MSEWKNIEDVYKLTDKKIEIKDDTSWKTYEIPNGIRVKAGEKYIIDWDGKSGTLEIYERIFPISESGNEE